MEVLFPVSAEVERGIAGDFGGDTEEETVILRALMAGLRDGEEILTKTGLEVAEFNQVMTMLEIKGRVRALGANKWVAR